MIERKKGNKADALFETETDSQNAGINDQEQHGTDYQESFGGAIADPFGIGIFMHADQGSEYLNAFTEAIKDLKLDVNKKGLDFKTTLIKMDKNNLEFSNLEYSVIIVSSKGNKSDNVYYHIILLEATGSRPRQVVNIMDELKQSRNMNLPLYVASDAFDIILEQEVTDLLQAQYDTKKENLISTNGVVVPYDQDPKEIAERVCTFALNTNLAHYAMETNYIRNINLPAYIQSTKNTFLQMDIVHVAEGGRTALGRPLRSDFSLGVTQVAGKQQSQYLNRRANNISLLNASGYLEYLPKTVSLGMGMEQKTILPAIIVNEVHGIKPTLDVMIMAMLSATAFANQSQLLSLLLSSKRDLGVLNYITNLEQSKSGFGEKLKLSTGKISKEKVIEALSKIFEPAPIVHMETEVYGANFDAMASFCGLNDMSIAAEANESIVLTLEDMLGTKMQHREVAMNEGILLPLGTWVDRNGNKRSIEEIDLAFVIENTNDPSLVYKWISSNVPMSITGQDPYVTKLEVINALIPNAEITAKAVRVPIDSAFLAEAATKAANIGFNPKLESAVNVGFTSYNDLSAIASSYANAGLKGVNFGQSMTGGQGYYNAPGINMFGHSFRV